MKKTLLLLAIAVLAVVSLAGCDQFVARNWGGTDKFKLPAGAQLVHMAWKDSDLWVLYYEPSTKRCVFAESSSVGLFEGKVVVSDCNPLALTKQPLN